MHTQATDSEAPTADDTGGFSLRAPTSAFRAFTVLVAQSFQRHWRVRQMGWVAVGLLALTVMSVSAVTASPAGWGLAERRVRGTMLTVRDRAAQLEQLNALPLPAPGQGVVAAVLAANAPVRHSNRLDDPTDITLSVSSRIDDPEVITQNRATVHRFLGTFAVMNFSRWVVLGAFLGFVLPLFTLAYASGAIGTERESRSLIWLMTRPMPRSAIYLGTFAGTLPWCLLFAGGGFLALCLAGGPDGRAAAGLYWPAAAAGVVTLAALFHLIGALFRRPVIVGLVYVFFFEFLVAALPGSLKLLSLTFYVRSLMYNEAAAAGFPADMLGVAQPVTAGTAWVVLTAATLGLTGLGAWLFARAEYRDDV